MADTDEQIQRVFNRATHRALHIGLYSTELFATKNKEEQLIEVAKHTDAA